MRLSSVVLLYELFETDPANETRLLYSQL